MNSEIIILLLLLGVYVVIIAGVILRELFFMKKETMRKQRTEPLVNGKEVVERMLSDAKVEGVTIVPKDAVIQRYYYSPNDKRLVISSHACYCFGYYDVMRAATTASNAIQSEEGYGMIDLYLKLSPFVEWMSRMLPLFFVVGLFCIEYGPWAIGLSMIFLWTLLLIMTLLMRHVDKDAARRSVDWLVSNGVVAESERPHLERIGRYLTNYNMLLVLTSGFVLFFMRSRMYSNSDKSV